jgi:hypothetical protein
MTVVKVIPPCFPFMLHQKKARRQLYFVETLVLRCE